MGDTLDRGGEMSTPDARLSAAERAALADLEAAATAADPGLAALLRGGASRRIRSDLQAVRAGLTKAAAAVAGAGWWGVPITVLGVLLMVLGLSAAIAVSFVGAVVAAIGLAALAWMAAARLALVAKRRTGTS